MKQEKKNEKKKKSSFQKTHQPFNKRIVSLCYTECVTDLNQQSEMIIFESFLTTFEVSVIFSGSWGSGENLLELELYHHKKV